MICHVCGDDRPEELLAVLRRRVLLRSTEAQENVRYCADRPVCAEGATRVSWLRPRWQCEDCDVFVVTTTAATRHCDEQGHSLAMSYWSLYRSIVE